jgi:hypothetical protein
MAKRNSKRRAWTSADVRELKSAARNNRIVARLTWVKESSACVRLSRISIADEIREEYRRRTLGDCDDPARPLSPQQW